MYLNQKNWISILILLTISTLEMKYALVSTSSIVEDHYSQYEKINHREQEKIGHT